VRADGRTARRAVLPASAQPAAEPGEELRGPCLDAGAGLGIRPGDLGACAAPDGERPVRPPPAAENHPRASGREFALQPVAHRPLQRLDQAAPQISGEEEDRRLFLRQLPPDRRGPIPYAYLG